MATVDLSHVQFWHPPLNESIRKPGRSGLATSPRKQPVSLQNKADGILKHNAQFKSIVAVARQDAVGAQGTIKEKSGNETV